MRQDQSRSRRKMEVSLLRSVKPAGFRTALGGSRKNALISD
jgi:hypothetical protein